MSIYNQNCQFNSTYINGSAPGACDPSTKFELSHEISSLAPVYFEWYFWICLVTIGGTTVAFVLTCLFCCSKSHKTTVIRLSQPMQVDNILGTSVAPEGIIMPDVTFYTPVFSLDELAIAPFHSNCEVSSHFRQERSRLTTPLKPLAPAYLATHPITVTTVRVPSFSSGDLTLPPGYVALQDLK